MWLPLSHFRAESNLSPEGEQSSFEFLGDSSPKNSKLKSFTPIPSGKGVGGVGHLAIIALLILACVGIGLVYAINGTVEFDEGFNLQIPVNLAKTGSYATTVAWGKPFDSAITTGPTMLLPTALVFRLAGIGLTQARLVPLVFFVIALTLAAILLYSLGKVPAAVLGLVWLACVPEFFRFGLKELGEVPALSFFLLALVSYNRCQPLRLGLLLGLAVLTKFEFILCLAPLFFLALLEGGSSWKFYAKVLAVTLAIPLGWEVIKLVGLGWAGYRDNVQAFLHVMDGATGLQPFSPTSVGTRASMLVAAFYPLPEALSLAALGIVLSAQFVRLKQTLEAAPQRAWMVMFSTAFLVWWLIASKTGWPRHLLPGLCVIALTTADGVVWLLRLAVERAIRLFARGLKPELIGIPLMAGAVLALAILPLRVQSRQVRSELNGSLLPVQTEMAARLVQIDRQGVPIAAWGWYQVPEMSFLSQVHFLDLAAVVNEPAAPAPLYILASKELYFGRDTHKVQTQFCGPVVYQNDAYVVYELKK
jgi:hypothetical protein